MKKRDVLPKVDMSRVTNSMLDEVVAKRKKAGAIVATKKGVVAECVQNVHKRECKFSNLQKGAGNE